EEEGTRTAPEPGAQQAHQQEERREVPERLVEERRMEVVELRVAERAMLGRDVELPRQIGRPPEGFFVEEVTPAADGLPEHHRRPGDVEPTHNRNPPALREPPANRRPDDETTVHRDT